MAWGSFLWRKEEICRNGGSVPFLAHISRGGRVDLAIRRRQSSDASAPGNFGAHPVRGAAKGAFT